jgi:hypothetical protein
VVPVVVVEQTWRRICERSEWIEGWWRCRGCKLLHALYEYCANISISDDRVMRHLPSNPFFFSSYNPLPIHAHTAMPPSASSRLTTTASLILERSRVISLGLTPSPSTDTKIVRALRQVKDELVKRDVEGDGEGTEEEWKRWEGLVGMMREDDVGRRQVAGLDRPERVS